LDGQLTLNLGLRYDGFKATPGANRHRKDADDAQSRHIALPETAMASWQDLRRGLV
jgi:outer membrane receptor protein involved in Fe transport